MRTELATRCVLAENRVVQIVGPMLKEESMTSHRRFGARSFKKVSSAAFAFGLAAAGSAAVTLTAPTSAHSLTTPKSPTATVANNTLTVTGTDGDDFVDVSLSPADPNVLLLDLAPDGSDEHEFDRNTFTAIAVFLGDGNDQFTMQRPSPDEALTVDAGDGDDVITGGDFNDLLFGGGGNDMINGNPGDDLIFGGRGDDAVNGGVGHDTAFLNSGDDLFVWNPGEGSDTVDGGIGHDEMLFRGAGIDEKMSLSANGDRAVFLRNIGTIRMDLDEIEEVTVLALGGSDSITVNDLRGTDVRDANIDLASPQGGSDGAADGVTVEGSDDRDHVRVNGDATTVDVDGFRTETHITGTDPSLDQLQVNTLAGNDRVDVDPAAAALIGVNVDLGADQH
jgi:RTX calcium-binding nonapeptide repeat (4 copies)